MQLGGDLSFFGDVDGVSTLWLLTLRMWDFFTREYAKASENNHSCRVIHIVTHMW